MRYLQSLQSLVIAALLIGLAGCALAPYSNEDVKSITDNEGVVVFSILFTTDERPVPDENTGKPFDKGGMHGPPRTKNTTCSLSNTPDNLFLHPSERFYSGELKMNQEHYLLRKLKKGEYKFYNIRCTRAQMEVSFPYSFKVEPGKAIYLGKFVVAFPKYLVKYDKVFTKHFNDIQGAQNYVAQNFPDLKFPLQLQPTLK
jgi:hypothetical protein